MTREEAKELLPILQAFAEGKEIEYRSKRFDEEWRKLIQIPGLSYDSFEYRVEPETKYRPFKNADECWQEMQKHQPFGWVRTRKSGWYRHINILYTDTTSFKGDDFKWDLSGLIDDVTFADGAPFGVKERA